MYESSKTPEQKEYWIHPFFSYYENIEKAYYFRTILYPLSYVHGTNYWKSWTFMYFFNGEEKYNQKENSEGEILLTPLLYWGYGSTDKEKFFSFFPFFGTIKDKISWSEIHFFLFPLYVSWQYKSYKAYSILWPFIMWGGDNFKRKDFRFLPFYSSKVHEGKYVHKTLLWPIFQWGSEDLDKRDPRHFFMFFPLYAHKFSESGSMFSYSILYPFSLIAWGKDVKRKSLDFRLFWFIIQYSKSEDPWIRKYIFFPFYINYQFGSPKLSYYQSTNFYLILLGNLRTDSALLESNYLFFIPFWYHHYRYYKQEQIKTISWKLWPIIHYWQEENSAFGWRILAIWPFPDDLVEKNWGTFYSLLEYNKHENEDKYFSVLLRLFSLRWNSIYQDFNLFFLGFQYKANPNLFEFSFLGGLIGFSKITYEKNKNIPLYFYPKYSQLLSQEEKESKYYFHLLWFKL